MRITIVFLLLFLSSNLFGQVKITEEFENIALSEVISILGSKYSIHIAYDPSLIKKVKVNVSLKSSPVDIAIKLILKDTQLSFLTVKPNYYSLVPSSPKDKLSGKIVDKENNPIPYVKLRILNTYSGAHSDIDGNYSLEYKSDSTLIIEVSSLGYVKQYISSDKLEKGSKVVMKRDVVNLPEVTVEYLAEGMSVSEDLSSISIRPKDLGPVPGTTEPDVFQLIQNIPGINSANATVNEIQIRGGTADQNQVLWDGIPLYHPGHFNGMISSINPNIVHKVNLQRGVYDPYFGGKVSGLIDLHSIDFIPRKVIGSAALNMLQGDAFVVAPIGSKFAVMVSGRQSYVGLWQSPTYKRYSERVYQETGILNTGFYDDDPEFNGEPLGLLEAQNDFRYYDLNSKLIYKPDSNNLITVSGLFTNNSLYYSTQDALNSKNVSYGSVASNRGLGVHWKHTWNTRWTSDFQTNFARYWYEFTNETRVEEEFNDRIIRTEKSNDVRHRDFKWKNNFLINANNTINFGYQLTNNDVNFSLLTSEDKDTVEQTGLNKGFSNILHFNYTYQKDRFLAKIGIRGTHYESTSEIYPEPRIYSQYSATKNLKIKASFGLQYQFVSQVDQFNDSQLGLSNRVWLMANNKDVPVISSNITNIGIVWQKKGWYLETQAYYKQLYGIVSFSDNPSLSSGLVRGNATAKGIDVLVKKRWKNYRSWISYSLGEVLYLFDDLLPQAFFAPFNQTHIFKWANTLTWRKFEFSSAFKLASGRRYTPISDIVLVGDPNDPEVQLNDLYEITYGKPNSKKLPVYHQLDLTLFYSFAKSPDKNWKMKLGITCFNVYNYKNVLSRSYVLNINGSDPNNPVIGNYAIDRNYLSITPNVLLRIEFD